MWNSLRSGTKVRLESVKYGGLPHRNWPHPTIHRVENTLLVLRYAAGEPVVEKDGSSWSSPFPVAYHLWTDRWFNVVTLLDPAGTRYYCNVAAPPEVEPGGELTEPGTEPAAQPPKPGTAAVPRAVPGGERATGPDGVPGARRAAAPDTAPGVKRVAAPDTAPDTAPGVKRAAAPVSHRISYVDLDIDVLVDVRGQAEIRDQAEFQRHRTELGYPEEVVQGAIQGLGELLDLIQARSGPFDPEEVLRLRGEIGRS